MTPDSIDCVGCGQPIPVPADHSNWSVTTDASGAVLGRHLLLDCPSCSTSAVRDDTLDDAGLAALGFAPNQRMNLVVEAA